MEPSVLLLDEPSSFLDPRSRQFLIDTLEKLDHTMIIATHDLDLALDICERVVLLKDGFLYTEGAAKDLLLNADVLKDCGLELPLSVRSVRKRLCKS
jgi:cobalt/nickel transport system ATP-binding protein